ncbi:hypothetical protein V3C99_017502 [Haemonchus contortus]|uniref:ShKT domain-containing protein n=1 Tax=Haemonchus contortus TaxID=6289 RepID=A0A7I4Z7H4_HAECO
MFIVVACFALASSVSGQITDLNCTNGDAAAPAFIASAFACEDKFATTTCTGIYTTAITPGGTTDRDAKCFTDEDAKKLATDACPKTCGYCCMTPEYKCKNKDFPRVKCSTVTPTQCRDPSWRPILAEDCPNVCGFCLEGGCVDTVIECENDPSICRNVDMQDFVKKNCQRTCGYCPTSTTAATVTKATVAPGSGTGTCTTAVDSNSNCANWVKNGFCGNTFYTVEQRRASCAKSCNLC